MYDDAFYETIREGVQRSAYGVVPILMRAFSPTRVVDVGCGEGWWAKVFADAGCTVLGIDHGPATGRAGIPTLDFDLEHEDEPDIAPSELPFQFDLALCLEVAEHLTPERGGWLVDFLCALAPVTVFSAAIPGQGGAHHVNERWPDYWRDLFATHGRGGSGALRWKIWNDETIEPWYRQNLLVFATPGHVIDYDGCPAVVHPTIYDWRRR